MKTVSKIGLLSCCILLLLSGCSGDSGDSAEPSTEVLRTNEATLTVNIPESVTLLDPLAESNAYAEFVMPLVFEKFSDMVEEVSVVGGAGEVSRSAGLVKVKMKKRMFSDKTWLDSDVVVRNYERVMHTPGSIYEDFRRRLRSVHRVDDDELIFEMEDAARMEALRQWIAEKFPSSSDGAAVTQEEKELFFQNALGNLEDAFHLYIVKNPEDIGTDRVLVGSGVYRFVEEVPELGTITLQKVHTASASDSERGEERAHTGEIADGETERNKRRINHIIIYRDDPESAAASFESGKFDAVFLGHDREMVHRIRTFEGAKVIKLPSYDVYSLGFNHGTLGSEALRRAVALSVNRKEVIRIVWGTLAEEVSLPIVSSYEMPVIRKWKGKEAFDISRSVKILEEEGWILEEGEAYRRKDGTYLRMNLVCFPEIEWSYHLMMYVRDVLVALGIDAELSYMKYEEFFAAEESGEEGGEEAIAPIDLFPYAYRLTPSSFVTDLFGSGVYHRFSYPYETNRLFSHIEPFRLYQATVDFAAMDYDSVFGEMSDSPRGEEGTFSDGTEELTRFFEAWYRLSEENPPTVPLAMPYRFWGISKKLSIHTNIPPSRYILEQNR